MSIQRFPVEAGHIVTFARAIGDEGSAWSGALRDGGPVPAPPTFVQASAQFDPEYPLRPGTGRPWWGSGRTAGAAPGIPSGERSSDGDSSGESSSDGGSSGGGTGLHAEQHYVYHRPLRAGMVLSATVRPGETWHKEGRRGGRLVFAETITEYRDEAGDLVVTARGVGVRTERVVETEPTS